MPDCAQWHYLDLLKYKVFNSHAFVHLFVALTPANQVHFSTELFRCSWSHIGPIKDTAPHHEDYISLHRGLVSVQCPILEASDLGFLETSYIKWKWLFPPLSPILTPGGAPFPLPVVTALWRPLIRGHRAKEQTMLTFQESQEARSTQAWTPPTSCSCSHPTPPSP